MAQPEKKTWWNGIGDILQAKELYMLLSSTGIASSIALWIGRRLPPGYDGQDKLLAGLAAFTVSGFLALGPVHINRQDGYPMIWRSDFEPRTLIIVQGTRLRKGRSAKLIVGGFAVVHALIDNYTILRIFGGDHSADEFRFDHHFVDSPTITIRITITAEPPLRVPFVRRYQLVARRQTGIVTLRELTGEEARQF